jgi:signal transduction histidine kinase
MTQDPIHLGRLMSAIAHDLRTPLATIYGFAKTIERGGGLDERQERFLGLIIAAAADMDRMIENVSTIGHIAEARLAVEETPVTTGQLAVAAQEAVPERADGRHVVVRPGAGATVDTDTDRAARAVALVAEAALRLEPSRQEAYLQPDGATIRIGPFSDVLLPGLEAHGRDVPVETARIVLAHLGATLATEGEELVVRFAADD